MPIDTFKKREVQNWMKAILAINKIAEVLHSAVNETFEIFISDLPDDEKEHLKIFYQCLKENEVEHFKTHTKGRKVWQCTHYLCKMLMERLLDNFKNGSQKCLWNFQITTPIRSGDGLPRATQTEETGGKWMLMKLYMCGDGIPRSTLNELDLSQTIRLMQSCNLFTKIDGAVPAFGKALESRSQLMHSRDNEVSDSRTKELFEEMETLVFLFTDRTSSQQTVKELHELRDTNLMGKEDTTEYKNLMSGVTDGENDYFERSQEDITCNNYDSRQPDVFERDPYALDLYCKALSQGEETDSTVRVNVVGNFAQGKTSLIKRLCMQNIKDVESSVEINHCIYEHIHSNVVFYTKDTEEGGNEVINRIASVAQLEKEKEVCLQAYQSQISCGQDYVFQEPFLEESSSASYEKYINTNEHIFSDETLETLERDLERSASMLDRSSENLDNDDASSIQKKEEKNTGITSLTQDEQRAFSRLLESNPDKNNIGKDLEIWDFGGQFIFYATHTLFHSRRAVYLLVFDLTTPLDKVVKDLEYPDENGDKNMEQYARFWMNSIHTYVGSEDASEPPVILVGTHKDKLKGDERTKQRFIEEYFEKIRKLFEDSKLINHIQPADFAVDNTRSEDTDILELRKEIIRVGAKYTKAKTIPARWIPLERTLKRIRKEKIITFAKVMEIDAENEYPLKEEEQVKLFLQYHHAKGKLFYFDEEPISAYVVLDAQYLIDAFKCIVTSGRFCRKDPTCRYLWNTFTRQARLETELIEKLWGRDTNSDFLKHKNVLLMYLQKHFIMSEASIYDENTLTSHGLGWYVVPSLLSDHSTADTLKEFLTKRRQSSVRFVMSFRESPLVQVVYHRLLAAMIGKWPVVQMASAQKKTLLLYENLGVFKLDNSHAGIAEVKDSDIDLRVISLCPSSNVDHETGEKFRRYSESIVKNEFRKLRNSSVKPENSYTSCFRCNNESHGLNGGIIIMPLEHIRDKKLEPCPDMTSH
ncbi:uncharacterized protein LOC123525238 [Mercenaria mercenaria]|uniref:uncharacterized protein LOC123525238 n=1 Tax=Mercenaria mercenaria TaxID=6596 RepID=UPI00234F8B26|nr:uncharacterized protein LOC123525238 [Mercenaria mercenaria]XP_053381381.1 uncharacterized protein LOC123525238 [Mercenaria mercenaria]